MERIPFKPNGFTLIELSVVMAIVAILAAVAVPNAIAWRNSAKFNSALRQVLTDFQLAKMRAVKESRNVVVEFYDFETGRYRLFVDNIDNAGNTENKYDAGIDLLIKDTAVPAGVVVSEARFPGGSNRMYFKSHGRPNGFGGHVDLTDGKNAKTIILQITGFLSIGDKAVTG